MNARPARLQPLHVCPRHIVHPVDVFEIEIEGHKLVLERIPTRTFQPLQVARGQVAFERDSITPPAAADRDPCHVFTEGNFRASRPTLPSAVTVEVA